MSLTVGLVLGRLGRNGAGSGPEQRVSREKRVQESMKWTNMDWGRARVGVGGVNNSHSSLYSPQPAVRNPSMPHLRPDSKAPWQPLGSGGHRERLLLSANEVGTWGSASLRLRFSAAHRTIDAEGCFIRESLPGDTIFSYLNPGWIVRLPGERRYSYSFLPCREDNKWLEIAVPHSGSSLSKQCSHANPQSAHKP